MSPSSSAIGVILGTLIVGASAASHGRLSSGCELIGCSASSSGSNTSRSGAVHSPHDPALTIGTLPNGMRYYIRANAMPAKRAMLWLAVNVGSIQEDDDQQGFAHFLEHMAFNGTRHFPGTSLIDFVEQAGMTFGADLNAYTSFDETVYQLTVPTDDAESFQQGWQVLEDWAGGGILIDSLEVVAERGVVLGEWRTRNPDTVTRKIWMHQLELIVGTESRYLRRFPIGLPTLLEAAQPAPIQRFYQDWYRPDLMAIIAVGDFDAKAVEREILSRFGKIPPAKYPRPFVRPPAPVPPEPVVDVFRGRVNPTVEVTWAAPVTPTDPAAAMRQSLVEQMLFPYVQRTLTKLSRQSRRPFGQALAGRGGGVVRVNGEVYRVQLAAHPDSLEQGLAAVLTEIERVAQHGIPESILAQQKQALLRRLEQAADAASAAPSRQLAMKYAQHYLAGRGGLLSASQELALARQILPEITPTVVAEAARFWRVGAQRAIMVQIPEFAHVHPSTRESLLALLDSVSTVSLSNLRKTVDPTAAATHSSEATVSSVSSSNARLITEPPTAGQIVREQHHPSSGVYEWTLSNGARVLFKQTANDPDELILDARSAGGASRLPDSLFYSPGRLVGDLLTAAEGLGDQNRDQLSTQLTTTALRELRIGINAFDEEIVVGGSPRELETLFQLMYLQFTAPKVDSTALAEWRRYGVQTLRMSENDKLASAKTDAKRRLSRPSATNVAFIELKEAMAVFRDRFGDAGDFTFTIVGASSPDQVKAFVQQYLASLPSSRRTERETPIGSKIREGTAIERTVERNPNVPPEKSQTALVFEGRFPEEPHEYLQERRRLSAVTWLVNHRLRMRLREQMAVTYGVQVGAQVYRAPGQRYRVTVQFLTAPDRMDESVAAVMQELDSIRTYGATAAEVAMAAAVMRRGSENAFQNNRNWVEILHRYDQLGISVDQAGVFDPTPVTSEEMRTAAQRYIPKEVFVQNTLLPTLESMKKAKEGASSTQP